MHTLSPEVSAPVSPKPQQNNRVCPWREKGNRVSQAQPDQVVWSPLCDPHPAGGQSTGAQCQGKQGVGEAQLLL